MLPPPPLDESFPNLVLLSSTPQPTTILSTTPSPTTAQPIFSFQPTTTTTVEEDSRTSLSYQPTPSSPVKKKFKPTRGRQFQLPQEAFDDENEIQDFTPKFFVDPGMKEKFAIIKVKNHNIVEPIISTSTTLSTTTTTVPTTSTSSRSVTTSTARRNRLLTREKSSFRRRKVKKVKGARRQNNIHGRTRKRLP